MVRHLVRNETCGKAAALDALGASLAFPSMAWDRVIVVTNIPSSISVDVVIQGRRPLLSQLFFSYFFFEVQRI